MASQAALSSLPYSTSSVSGARIHAASEALQHAAGHPVGGRQARSSVWKVGGGNRQRSGLACGRGNGRRVCVCEAVQRPPVAVADSLRARYEERLKDVVESHQLAYGIFWEEKKKSASKGVLKWEGCYNSPTNGKSAPYVNTYIKYASKDPGASNSGVTFEPGEGVPGRAYQLGEEWVTDVLTELSVDDFPRKALARAAGIRTVFAVRVPGGVAECGSLSQLPRQDNLLASLKSAFATSVV